MLGLFLRGKKSNAASRQPENSDVAKLFFDSFSRRVTTVEEGLRGLSSAIEKLRLSTDRGQISDLVLLDRLQRAERLLEESMAWIKRVADKIMSSPELGPKVRAAPMETSTEIEASLRDRMSVPIRKLVSMGGDIGALPSITTPTELQVLSLLAEEGPKSAPEIGRLVGRSREHTARLMKKLFEEGYIRRDQTRIPFRYSLVDRVRESFQKLVVKGEEKEQVSVPQT